MSQKSDPKRLGRRQRPGKQPDAFSQIPPELVGRWRYQNRGSVYVITFTEDGEWYHSMEGDRYQLSEDYKTLIYDNGGIFTRASGTEGDNIFGFWTARYDGSDGDWSDIELELRSNHTFSWHDVAHIGETISIENYFGYFVDDPPSTPSNRYGAIDHPEMRAIVSLGIDGGILIVEPVYGPQFTLQFNVNGDELTLGGIIYTRVPYPVGASGGVARKN